MANNAHAAVFLSFSRRRESRFFSLYAQRVWIPAFPPKADPPQADAGMTTGKFYFPHLKTRVMERYHVLISLKRSEGREILTGETP